MPRTRSLAWSELKLGVVGVVALLLVTVLVVAVGGEGGFFWQRYPLKMQFADVRGLKPGAVVRAERQGGRHRHRRRVRRRAHRRRHRAVQGRAAARDDRVGRVDRIAQPARRVDDRHHARRRPARRSTTGSYVKTTGVGTLEDLTATASTSLAEAGQAHRRRPRRHGHARQARDRRCAVQRAEQLVASAAAVTRNLNSGKGTIGGLMQDPAAYQALKASLENLQTMTARINSGQGALGRFLNDEAMAKSLSGTADEPRAVDRPPRARRRHARQAAHRPGAVRPAEQHGGPRSTR